MRAQARATSPWWGATLLLELAWSAGILPRWADSTSLLGPDFLRPQRTGLGLGLLGDFEEVAKGGVAGMVTATGPLGAGGWGSALGALGGFGSQGLLVLPPLPVPPPVPGGPLFLTRRRAAAAAALQRALGPQLREPPFDHVPHGDVDRGA